MFVRIAFLLTTLLVMPLQADTDALEDYFLHDTRRTSMKLTGPYERGFVLKSLPGAKPFNATLRVSMEGLKGLVLSFRGFGHFACRDGAGHSGAGDVLKAEYSILAANFCSNDSRAVLKRLPEMNTCDNEVTISYARRENSSSRFELAVTPLSCGTEFECEGEKLMCVWSKLKCDGGDTCEDGTGEEVCIFDSPPNKLKVFLILLLFNAVCFIWLLNLYVRNKWKCFLNSLFFIIMCYIWVLYSYVSV